MKKMKTFGRFKLEKKSGSKKDCIYLFLMYMGGDADTKHPEEFKLDFKLSEIDTHIDELNKEIDLYKRLKEALDRHDIRTSSKAYDIALKDYGKEVADMLDNVPNDPQADYQFSCYLDYIKIVAYDEEGDRYESYV